MQSTTLVHPLHQLHRYACATFAAAFVLLIAGGLVTSTDSGLAVPDWPLAYGQMFPPMVGGILYEHGHRMIAGVVGLMIAALAIWLWRVEPRPWVRRLGTVALIGVVVQALLGGLTVILLLPPAVSIAHACLAQLVFSSLAGLAVATSPAWQDVAAHPTDAATRVQTALLAAAVFVQLIFGAVIRHTGRGLTLHVAGAVVVLLSVARLMWRLSRQPARDERLWRIVRLLPIAVVAQIGLGLTAWAFGQPVLVATAHVALGAAILALSCMSALWAHR